MIAKWIPFPLSVSIVIIPKFELFEDSLEIHELQQ